MSERIKATAYLKNLRTSPRKVTPVAAIVRRRSVADANTILDHTRRMCAQDVKKVINSAAANATNNLRLSLESLMIDEIIVSNGIVYKRVMPSARGNAHPFMKRCTNIKVVVSGLKKEVKLKKEVTESKKVDVDAKVEKATKKKEAK